ncbi:MAG: GlsB/YeaQ/YmgE family stress response membrane protein, partial [Bacteroidales bacterium]|nr:GlsB/YeaQ/YmgE family stress response membrane protein [Bacteroidales bacterium]
CIIVGVIGGFLGSWIFGMLGLAASETFWGRLLVGTLGAVVLLFILSLFRKK